MPEHLQARLRELEMQRNAAEADARLTAYALQERLRMLYAAAQDITAAARRKAAAERDERAEDS